MSAEELSRTMAAVAGVATSPCPDRYVIENDPEIGGASLARGLARRSLRTEGILRIEPGGALLEALEANRVSPGNWAAEFAMRDWIRDDSAWDDETPAPATVAWRALLVERKLLAHPEWITLALPDEASSWPIAERSALETLRREFGEVVRVDENRLPHLRPKCRDCLDTARRLREERSDAAGMGFRVLPMPERDCPHLAPAVRALKALCLRYPTIVFELVSWLVPASKHERGGRSTPARRFTLAPHVCEATLSEWLLGEAPKRERDASRAGTEVRHGGWASRRAHRPVESLDDASRVSTAEVARNEMALLAATAWETSPDIVDTTGDSDDATPPGMDGDAGTEIEPVYAAVDLPTTTGATTPTGTVRKRITRTSAKPAK